ncbi:hypothetical protein HGRIS_010856 [Hohenbuehelia grisea]|uniref:Uncharacterized protein n=1 Tax=Hohenbuehelia grisea TaxID=104357 RepID=A0ABR3IY14_9AGAR
MASYAQPAAVKLDDSPSPPAGKVGLPQRLSPPLKRQMPAADPGMPFGAYPTTSTSSFNWWPYPPGGVETTTSNPPMPAAPSIPTSGMPFVAPPPSMAAFTIPPDRPFFFSPPNPDTAPSTSPIGIPPLSSNSTASPVTSTSSATLCSSSGPCTVTAVPSSTTPSSVVIQISALDPLPASAPSAHSFPKKSRPSPPPHIKTIIISVCAVVGVVLGSVIAWFCYGCIMARRRRKIGSRHGRNAMLEVGPAYSTEGIDVEKCMEEQSEPSRPPVGSRSMTGDTLDFSWDIPRSHEEDRFGDGEDQAFLAPPTRTQTTRTTRFSRLSSKSVSAMRRNTTKSVYSTVTGFTASPNPMSLLSDEDEDESLVAPSKPYESLRKGSRTIRRDLLERVQKDSLTRSQLEATGQGSRRRVSRGHVRADSDFRLDDGDEEKLLPQVPAPDEPSTQWVAGSGFRIVEEDMKSLWGTVGEWASRQSSSIGARASSSDTKERKSLFSSWLGQTSNEDKYTPVPPRKSPTKAQRTRLVRDDSSVLPTSPPQVMSPPLESQLFFTPTMSQDPSVSPSSVVSPEKRPRTSQRREGRVLRSAKPPRMPFPAGEGADDVYRGRLIKGSSRSERAPVERAAENPRAGRRDPAFHQVSRIVKDGWGGRDAGAIAEDVGSPNGFGSRAG